MRPIAHARDETVLHWIDVTIFDVTCVISFISDQVFPKPALPHAALPARLADRTEPLLLRQCFCEPGFDQPPSHREIGIAWWQRQDRMDMIRQDNDSVDDKRMVQARCGNRLPQCLNVIDKQRLPPLKQIDGEEPASTRDEGATIIWHLKTLASAQYASLLRALRAER